MHIRNCAVLVRVLLQLSLKDWRRIEQVVYSQKDTELDLDEFAESEISSIGPIDEINYDYQVVGTSVIPAGQQILTVAARKDDVEPMIEMFEGQDCPYRR